MNNKILILNLFLFIHILSFSQIVGFEKKDTTKPFIIFENNPHKKVVIGLEHELIYTMFRNQLTNKKERATVQTFEPHISYYPYKDIGIGVVGKVEFFKSNYLVNNTPNVYELGIFTRWFIPFETNVKVFNRISLSLGLSYSKANYSRRDDDIYYFASDSSYTMFTSMSQSLVRLFGTTQFKIYKGLNFKMSWRYEMFINNYYGFRPTVGLEYHFYERNEK